ncbi:Melatonin receptor type 1B [Holothuria leucospilota]|uniref:Melatonin receptor type 1B n=1 Tax=Holothuria leucospilota TaxID=206669 RepID=A0A9Q0YGH2_HOLLE|nr:Melatonin receptor type 1B [Holothuria leucospilota]
MEAGFNDTFSDEGLSPSTPWSKEFVFESSNQRLIAAIVTCLVTVIGIPGNSMVILAVMLSKKLQNRTNVFVVNLACADMLTCSVLPFQAVALLSETWPLSTELCGAVAILMWLGLGSAVMNLALIAFTRYSIITKSRAFTDRMFTNNRICLLVCGAWLIPPVFILIPPAFGVGAVAYSHRYKLCTADSTNPMSDIYAYISLLVELPCLVVIIVCYFNIYRFVRKAGFNLTQSKRFTIANGLQNWGKTPQISTEVAVFHRQVKVTKKLFIIVCTYIICVMPFGLACAIPAPIYPIIPWAYLLLFLNLCLNPIIYGIKHPQFKEVFWPIITCSWKNIPEPSSLIASFSNIAT